MQTRYLKKLIVAWMVAWLPVAGVLASTMPITSFAGSADSAIASAQSNSIEATADSARAPLPCHTSDLSEPNTDGKPCSHCVLCHLAGAIVPPTLPAMAINMQQDSPKSIDRASFTSFIAELPQRPPSPSRA